MLCLGSGSTCDVCLEPFGNDTKAPCSIECGHVFCLNCLNQITRLKCPLCRSRFEPQGFVKLHIDVDDVRSSSHSPERPPSASPAELEARRLQEAIANIANEGSTEASLRQLIQDCKSFLAGQPRNLFTELRFIHRVVSYLCDVKSDLVKTKRELAHLTTEKARSDQMVVDLEADMKRDRSNAQALEDNLRDYCSKAQGAYFGVAELYLHAESERTRLRDVLRQYGITDPLSQSEQAHKASDVRPSTEAAQDILSPLTTQLLISPLPEVAGTILQTSAMGSFMALPDVDECCDKKIPKPERCGAVGCPFSCQCRSVDLFDDPSQILTSVTRAASGSSSHEPAYEAPVPLGASGLSLTAPGPTANSTADDPPTRPASPMRSSSSSGSSTPREPPRIKPLPPQRHNSFQLRDRLYNLLQDESSSSPASSSMPNLTSSHFPSTLTSQHASTSTSSASQSRYGSLSRPPPSRTSEISATSEQVYGKPITRASDAAHALERSQQLERGRSSRSRSRRNLKEQEDDAPPPTPDKDVHTSQAPAPSTSRRPETPKTPRSRSTRREESQSRPRPTTTLSYSQSISNFYSAPGPSRTPIYGHPTLKTSNSFRATPPFSSYHSSIGSGKGKMIASSMVHSGVTYA